MNKSVGIINIITEEKVEYVVIGDYGEDDDWKDCPVAFGPFKTKEAAERKAEEQNYHSASIVKLVNGKRVERVS